MQPQIDSNRSVPADYICNHTIQLLEDRKYEIQIHRLWNQSDRPPEQMEIYVDSSKNDRFDKLFDDYELWTISEDYRHLDLIVRV